MKYEYGPMPRLSTLFCPLLAKSDPDNPAQDNWSDNTGQLTEVDNLLTSRNEPAEGANV